MHAYHLQSSLMNGNEGKPLVAGKWTFIRRNVSPGTNMNLH